MTWREVDAAAHGLQREDWFLHAERTERKGVEFGMIILLVGGFYEDNLDVDARDLVLNGRFGACCHRAVSDVTCSKCNKYHWCPPLECTTARERL